jgi:hypothetical protein
LSGKETVLKDFEWPEGTNGFKNNQKDREIAAGELAKYVLKNHNEGEDITLIGHSHGGNVAIQAIDMIRSGLGEGDNANINLITLATPAYNGQSDPENPENTSVDAHLHFFSSNDDIQVKGSSFMGNKLGSRRYLNSKTQQFEVVDYKMKKNFFWGKYRKYNHGKTTSHYIHSNIKYVQDIIDRGIINYSDWNK